MILHGWQPRKGTGLNIFEDLLGGGTYQFVNRPTTVTLNGTPFDPSLMNENEKAIADSSILFLTAAPTSSTAGALGQVAVYNGTVYYCSAVSPSFSGTASGASYFWAGNIPISFNASGAVSWDGSTLTVGGTVTDYNKWPEGTEITLTDNSTYTWSEMRSMRVEYGTYVGTGTYGSSNPNTLTFSGTPVFLWVSRDGTFDMYYNSNNNTHQRNGLLLQRGSGRDNLWQSTSGSISYGRDDITWDNNSVSWYCSQSGSSPISTYGPHLQLNASGETYYYVALCV